MYAFKRFMKMISSAKTLHACVRTRHYEKITGTLDKMTLPEGTMLMVNECEKYDRAVSHLYLSDERTDFENQESSNPSHLKIPVREHGKHICRIFYCTVFPCSGMRTILGDFIFFLLRITRTSGLAFSTCISRNLALILHLKYVLQKGDTMFPAAIPFDGVGSRRGLPCHSRSGRS